MFCHQATETMREKRVSRGFTLIEVLMAMAIFSVGILAVGAMQINSANSNTGARIHTEEYTWVVDRIERLTALGYDDDDLDPNDPADPNDFRSVVQGPYTISWTVVDDSPVAGAKRIAVTATGSHHRARPVTIDFIKAR
jgi:prepilin-type N-terminal cleavage/methylation domain-containing protein